jgi:hypothetical protein
MNIDANQYANGLPDGAYLIDNVQATEHGKIKHYDRDQIKIFTQGRFMYAFNNALTQSIDVGAGNATWRDGVMVEVPTVNHDGPVAGLSFDVAIELTANGFDQSIKGFTYEDGRCVDMLEHWDTASTQRSEYDGLWQLNTDGYTETRMIGGGHFIWLQVAAAGAECSTGFGFGTIQFQSDGTATETGMTGSEPDYGDTQNSVTMETNGGNQFTRSHLVDGELITQTYIRV